MAKLVSQINKKMRLYFKFTAIVCMLIVLRVPVCPAGSIRETPVVKAVQRVGPSVVNISTEFEVYTKSPFSGFGDPFFDSFFRDFFEHGSERSQKRHNLGSGVIIDGKRGFILTNAHVIERTGNIVITLHDGREFEAQIIGADPDSDLAVLQIESEKPLPSIEMGNSDDILIGETVIAIGNPFGFNHTVTTGVVSATNRSVRTKERVYNNFLQTDASINPGNSGGPLLNIEGELIGVNTAIYADAQGIGFAIPINKAGRIVSDLIKYGEVVQAWIGVGTQPLNPKMARYLKANKGILVNSIEKESPAEQAGIREGDIILEVDGAEIESVDDYVSSAKGIPAGDAVSIRILRQGREKTVSVKTKTFPIERADELIKSLFGIEAADVSERRYSRYTTAREGVVITKIDKNHHLYQVGAKPGDVIRQVDETPIRNLQEFKRAAIKNRMKRSVVILLQRGGAGYYITINLGA